MSTFRMIELVGTSQVSFTAAIQDAIQTFAQGQQGISWFEVVEQRGKVVDGKVTEFQVKINVAFKV